MIGRGATSTVYRVFDLSERRWCAAKVLHADDPDGSLRVRFEREALVMSSLDHPGVVGVLDADLDSDPPWMILELLDVGSTSDWVGRHGPMPTVLAVSAILDICGALGALHDEGGIHRDVKPQNILVGRDGRCRLSDFGLTRVDSGDDGLGPQLTEVGSVMGTLAFMAPEQRMDASSVDHRVDIYALGATLYALLVGRAAADLAVLADDDPRLTKLPAGLGGVIRRCCEFEPDDRYPDVRALAEELAALELPTVGTHMKSLVDGVPELPDTPPPWSVEDARELEPLYALACVVDGPSLERGAPTGPLAPGFDDASTQILAGPEAAPEAHADPTRASGSSWGLRRALALLLGAPAAAGAFAVLGLSITLFVGHGRMRDAEDAVSDAREQVYFQLHGRLVERLDALGVDRTEVAETYDVYRLAWREPERLEAAGRVLDALERAADRVEQRAGPGPADELRHLLRSARAAQRGHDASVDAWIAAADTVPGWLALTVGLADPLAPGAE